MVTLSRLVDAQFLVISSQERTIARLEIVTEAEVANIFKDVGAAPVNSRRYPIIVFAPGAHRIFAGRRTRIVRGFQRR